VSTLRLLPKGSADPATTTLTVRVPTQVEIIDVPLQLYNVPDAEAER